jgi:hypothetical protein
LVPSCQKPPFFMGFSLGWEKTGCCWLCANKKPPAEHLGVYINHINPHGGGLPSPVLFFIRGTKGEFPDVISFSHEYSLVDLASFFLIIFL